MTKHYSELVQSPRTATEIDIDALTPEERSSLRTLAVSPKAVERDLDGDGQVTTVYYVRESHEDAAIGSFWLANEPVFEQLDLDDAPGLEAEVGADTVASLRYYAAFQEARSELRGATGQPGGIHRCNTSDGARWVFDSEAFELGIDASDVVEGVRVPGDVDIAGILAGANPFVPRSAFRDAGVVGNLDVLFRDICNQRHPEFAMTVRNDREGLERLQSHHGKTRASDDRPTGGV